MLRLEQYLSYYTVRYLQHRRSQGISPDLKFVIDHSNNPGEGEVIGSTPFPFQRLFYSSVDELSDQSVNDPFHLC